MEIIAAGWTDESPLLCRYGQWISALSVVALLQVFSFFKNQNTVIFEGGIVGQLTKSGSEDHIGFARIRNGEIAYHFHAFAGGVFYSHAFQQQQVKQGKLIAFHGDLSFKKTAVESGRPFYQVGKSSVHWYGLRVCLAGIQIKSNGDAKKNP